MKTQAPPVGMESSFVAHLQHTQPELLPGRGMADQHAQVAHGTTIVALTFADGVVMAGDRRATVGNMIASSHMEKVFAADSHSVIGVSGSAGLAVDLARLFAVELEHYEKIEGTELSLMGKSNRLAALVRAQLPYLAQGLVAIPLFAGVDKDTGTNKIFSFDVTGGRFEEYHHHSVGSGSPFARGSLKKIWRAGATRVQAISMALRALQDAAEEDSATSGPDPRRGLWPVVWSVTGEGVQRVPESEVATLGQESWAELT